MRAMRPPELLLLLILAAVPAGCGGDDDEKEKREAPALRTTLKLVSPGGAIKYDREHLSAPAGRITIDYTNDSLRPHNVIVIRGAKLDYKKRAVLGMRVIHRGTGETRLKASATLEPGTYTYYCSVQNHAALGMRGTLVVR
jgi:plastocyanin